METLENGRLDTLKNRVTSAISVDYGSSWLGRKKARQFTATYTCDSAATVYIERVRLILDKDRHILYEARIVARKGDFERDVKLYEQIASTWKETPLL